VYCSLDIRKLQQGLYPHYIKQWGVDIQLYSFFNLGPRWEWVFNTMPQTLNPRERPGTQYIGGWVVLRVGVDGGRKSRHCRDSIPGQSSPHQVTILTTLF